MTQPEQRLRAVSAYGVAAVIVAIALAIRGALSGLLEDRAPLMLFIPAAMLAALYGGRGPGLFAVIAGELVGDYFFVRPGLTLGPRTGVEWTYALTFCIVSGSMVMIVEALRRSRAQASRSLNLAEAAGAQLRRTLTDMGRVEAKSHQLAMMVESADDAIVTTDPQGEVKSWNQGAERLFGYTAAEAIGTPILRLVPERLQAEVKELLRRLEQGNRVEAFETARVRKDGREIPVSVSVSGIRDEAGRFTGASFITRDITELKRANAALQESEGRFHALADAAPLLICVTDTNHLCTWTNRAWQAFTGRAPEKELGEGWMDRMHETDRALYRNAQASMLEQRKPFELEYRLLREDGKYRWMFERSAPHFGPDGTFMGYLRAAMDVTERREAEEALERKFDELRATQQQLREQNQELGKSRQALEAERSRYRELFNSAPVAYVITDPQGVVQQVNAAASTLLQEEPAFLEGLPLARLLAKDARPAFFVRLGGLANNESAVVENWETTIQLSSGSSFPCSLLANRVQDPERGLTGLRWILRDITERKQAEEKVLRLNTELENRVRERTAALEAANRELESFSYSVSHDLRAPLRSVVGFSKALMQDYRDKLDPEGLTYLQCSYDAGLRMSRLIEDLLGLSRASRVELQHCQLDLSELAQTIIAEFRRREPERQVEVAIAPDLHVHADEGLLRIALENLLSNAWKFTSRKPKAQIEVGSFRRNAEIVYFVRDNGAGFSMAHASRLFGVFQRFHLQDEFPGTGIGLATVRRIFRRHGGEVWADSKVDEGATFYFTLPEAAASVVEPDREARAA